jgi:prepilin-type processing-associated H-X9-DG protein
MSDSELPEKIARCPGDGEARLGVMGGFTDSANPGRDYKIRRADGSEYQVKVSIGANVSPLSASLATSKTGEIRPRWVKPNHLRVPGWDTSKVMLWGDWQNNPEEENPAVAVIKPGGFDQMGSLAFRHRGAANAVFFDGHVGEIRTTLKLTNGGLDLAEGEAWTNDNFTLKHYQVFYPFGPGFHGTRVEMRGIWPGIALD